jgi:hypothetical protein
MGVKDVARTIWNSADALVLGLGATELVVGLGA